MQLREERVDRDISAFPEFEISLRQSVRDEIERRIAMDLTKDELEVVCSYLSKKMSRLEESGLTDSYCYPRLASAYHKLKKELDEAR